MSAYMTFNNWDELLAYLKTSDYPKCATVNYLPESDGYALWIGNQPYYTYEQLIDFEQKEKQWLYGKLNQIRDIIESGRSKFKFND